MLQIVRVYFKGVLVAQIELLCPKVAIVSCQLDFLTIESELPLTLGTLLTVRVHLCFQHTEGGD